MEMTGSERILASRQTVWDSLNDPDILRQCIPGCQSLEKTGENQMAATVKIKIGVIAATFNGEVRLEDIDAPNGYTIAGEGKGGVAGFAKGNAKVSLADDGDATVLNYTVNAQVGGKLAQLGARLSDSTARKLAGQFFARFNELVGAR